MATAEFIDDVVLIVCPVCKNEIKALVTFEPIKQPENLPAGEIMTTEDRIKHITYNVRPVNVNINHNCRSGVSMTPRN